MVADPTVSHQGAWTFRWLPTSIAQVWEPAGQERDVPNLPRGAALLAPVLVLTLCLFGLVAAAQDAGETSPEAEFGPRIVEDDLFRAGRSIDLRARVEGDLFAAGGWVGLDVEVTDNLISAAGMLDASGEVLGDFIVGGGLLDLAADIGDNLVAAGLVVTISGDVGRKLFASAGRLKLQRDLVVADSAWLAAASADIAGTIRGDAVIVGGSVTIRGRIEGDVEVTALTLSLAPSAVIEGRLVHHGPEPPELAEGAVVAGGIEHTYEPETAVEPDAGNGSEIPPILWLLIILVLGLALDLLIPGYVRRSSHLLVNHPFASFGLGLAILFTTPVLIVILVVSVLGFALGLAAIAAYGTLLLLGPAVALFAFTNLAMRWVARRQPTPLRRRLGFVLALLILGLAGWLPYVGTPLLWSVSVLGLGAATWEIYGSMRGEPPYAKDASE